MKVLQTKAKCVTYLKGWVKNAFLEDVIDQKESEAEVLREIVREYYEKRNKNPNARR